MIIRTRISPVVVVGYVLAVVGFLFYPELIALAIGLIVGAGLEVELGNKEDIP